MLENNQLEGTRGKIYAYIFLGNKNWHHSKILWLFLEDFTWKYDKKMPGFNSNLQVKKNNVLDTVVNKL